MRRIDRRRRSRFGKPPIRKKYIVAAAAILVAAYSGWWWLAATAIQNGVERWIAGQQAKGARISPSGVTIVGYPFAFSIKLVDVAAVWPDGYSFSSQSLKARTRPWAMHRFKVTATGGVSGVVPTGTSSHPLRIAGETLRGHASFRDSPWPNDVDFAADSVSASQSPPDSPNAAELTISTLTLAGTRPDSPPKADTDIAADLTLRANDLAAPAFDGNPLGATIRQAGIHLQLMGIPPAAPDAAGLKAWRDAGGTLNLPDLSLSWGPLSVRANGTMALDSDMQPEGAFSAHLTGFEQTIDALAATGWIKPSAASIAKLALGLAAMPGADGKPTVQTPITIQNRRVSLGPAKLGQIPEIHFE